MVEQCLVLGKKHSCAIFWAISTDVLSFRQISLLCYILGNQHRWVQFQANSTVVLIPMVTQRLRQEVPKLPFFCQCLKPWQPLSFVIGGGTYLTKINFLKFIRCFLMFIYVSNQDQKFFLGDLKIWVRVRLYYFFDFPIGRSRIKIDVDLSVTYQENNRNSKEKSELSAKRKRPKTIRKYHFPEIW